MTIDMLFGRGHLPLNLPEGAVPHVIEKPPFPATGPASELVMQTLENPIGSAPLAELARGRSSACILICDPAFPKWRVV